MEMVLNGLRARPKCWGSTAPFHKHLKRATIWPGSILKHLDASLFLQHRLTGSCFVWVQHKPNGECVFGSKEVRLHCTHNWNPTESKLKMIPWQEANRTDGASFQLFWDTRSVSSMAHQSVDLKRWFCSNKGDKSTETVTNAIIRSISA